MITTARMLRYHTIPARSLTVALALALVACSTADEGTSSGGAAPPPSGNGNGDGTGQHDPARDAGTSTGHDAGIVDPTGDSGSDASVEYHCDQGLPKSLNDLKALVTQSTVSKVTPMGTNFETPAKHVATSAELAFLKDAAQSPAIQSSLSGLHMQAFTVKLYPSGAPSPADINQHAIGDCDGDTAMASMAYMNPAFVQRIITDNHDNTFTVAMYDPMGHPLEVKVDNKFLADSGNHIGAVSGKNDVATWSTVLEKAVMKYNSVFNFIGDIEGIGSEHLTPLFTGEGGSFAFDRGALTPAQLTRAVTESLAAGKFISGGFGNETPLGKVKSITAHGYAVFVPADSATMISMRNPWGVSPLADNSGFDASTDGVLDIPPTKEWASDIDLRIIDPGAACGPGMTTPYVPKAAQIVTKDVRITERHRAR
jgi:hypothetical protein